MNKSDEIAGLAGALITFQSQMPLITKNAVNPFYHSKYADLNSIWDTIRKPLTDNGLAVCQTLSSRENDTLLETILLHKGGQWISGALRLNPQKDDPQGIGSALTYARRYGLCAILGIAADEDDDAEIAQGRDKKVKPKTEEKVKQKTPSIIEVAKEIGQEMASAEQIAAIKKLVANKVDVKGFIKEAGWEAKTAKELTFKQAERLLKMCGKVSG